MKKLSSFLITLLLAFSLTKNSLGTEKENKLDWIGAFTTDTVPIKGCYIVKNYGIYWHQYSFNLIQWNNFKNNNNYLYQFGRAIDEVTKDIALDVKEIYIMANALVGVDFKFITNYEPLVSKNYYIDGKRADGIGWGAVILIGNAVRVECRK